MKNLDAKVEQLKSKGWKVVKRGEVKMNNRYYKNCRMQNGDEFITVNHQGGTEGLVSGRRKNKTS